MRWVSPRLTKNFPLLRSMLLLLLLIVDVAVAFCLFLLLLVVFAVASRGGVAEWSRRFANDREVRISSGLIIPTRLQSIQLSIFPRSVNEYPGYSF